MLCCALLSCRLQQHHSASAVLCAFRFVPFRSIRLSRISRSTLSMTSGARRNTDARLRQTTAESGCGSVSHLICIRIRCSACLCTTILFYTILYYCTTVVCSDSHSQTAESFARGSFRFAAVAFHSCALCMCVRANEPLSAAHCTIHNTLRLCFATGSASASTSTSAHRHCYATRN